MTGKLTSTFAFAGKATAEREAGQLHMTTVCRLVVRSAGGWDSPFHGFFFSADIRCTYDVRILDKELKEPASGSAFVFSLHQPKSLL